jgi:hypothetical protein
VDAHLRAHRASRLAAAVLALAVLGPATAAAAPDPATLTLAATTRSLAPESRTYLVLAAGPPPPAASLVDADGTTVVPVRITRDAGAACSGEPARRIGLGTDPWCLHLAGVTAGRSVTGTLTGTGTVLKLTVAARHAFWVPALVAAVALLLAVGVAALAGRFVPRWTTSALLRRERSDDGGVTGLAAWATDAAARLEDADVLARVRWAKRSGRARVLATRADLRAALDAQPRRIPVCPLRTVAETEAARTDVTRADLLTDGGDVAVGAAEHLLQLVEAAASGIAAFDAISQALIDTITDPARRQKAQGLADVPLSGATNYLSEFTLEPYLESLRQHAQRIEQVAREDQMARQNRQPGPEATPAERYAGVMLAGFDPASLLRGARRTATAVGAASRTLTTIVPVALLALALMTVAVVAVLATQYLPNRSFGTAADYVTLAVTAFGSAQAAVVFAALLQLGGPAPWRP